jgi:phosphoribosylformylglycinamidine synthase subunit PurS
MPKPEILDPQGKAVTGALARLGFAGMSVRQGKRFEIELEGEVTEDRLEEVRRAAETLLANTVIETFDVRVEAPPESPDDDEPDDDEPDDDQIEPAEQSDQDEPTEQAELAATQAG